MFSNDEITTFLLLALLSPLSSVIMCSIMVIWHRKASKMSFGDSHSSVEIYARLYYHFPIVFQWPFDTLYNFSSLPSSVLVSPSTWRKVHLILFILLFTQHYHKVSQWLWNFPAPKPLFNDITSNVNGNKAASLKNICHPPHCRVHLPPSLPCHGY